MNTGALIGIAAIVFMFIAWCWLARAQIVKGTKGNDGADCD